MWKRQWRNEQHSCNINSCITVDCAGGPPIQQLSLAAPTACRARMLPSNLRHKKATLQPMQTLHRHIRRRPSYAVKYCHGTYQATISIQATATTIANSSHFAISAWNCNAKSNQSAREIRFSATITNRQLPSTASTQVMYTHMRSATRRDERGRSAEKSVQDESGKWGKGTIYIYMCVNVCVLKVMAELKIVADCWILDAFVPPPPASRLVEGLLEEPQWPVWSFTNNAICEAENHFYALAKSLQHHTY